MVASVVTDVAAERLWVLLAYGQRLIGVALERRLVETPASRSNARRSARSFRSESSIKSSIPTAYWSFCKPSTGKAAICAAFAEPSGGLEPPTPHHRTGSPPQARPIRSDRAKVGQNLRDDALPEG